MVALRPINSHGHLQPEKYRHSHALRANMGLSCIIHFSPRNPHGEQRVHDFRHANLTENNRIYATQGQGTLSISPAAKPTANSPIYSIRTHDRTLSSTPLFQMFLIHHHERLSQHIFLGFSRLISCGSQGPFGVRGKEGCGWGTSI